MACFGKLDGQQLSNVEPGQLPCRQHPQGPPLTGGEALPGRTRSWALRMGCGACWARSHLHHAFSLDV